MHGGVNFQKAERCSSGNVPKSIYDKVSYKKKIFFYLSFFFSFYKDFYNNTNANTMLVINKR